MSTKTLAIKVFYGDQLVDTQTLSQDVIKIGKLKSSHVCLDDEAVARMHAVIEVSGDEVRVIDLGSATGTMLNGGRIGWSDLAAVRKTDGWRDSVVPTPLADLRALAAARR